MPDEQYNPFQAEEVNIQDILKRAIAQKLRSAPTSDTDLYGYSKHYMDDARADRQFDESLAKRTSLADEDKAALSNLLKNYGPETQALGSNRLTFPQALTNVKEKESMRLDDEDRAARAARRAAAAQTQAPGGGSALPQTSQTAQLIAEAMDDLNSSRPHIVARAKEFLKQVEPRDPKLGVRIGANGQLETIPGALAAFREQTHPFGYKQPSGYGGPDVEVPAPGQDIPPGRTPPIQGQGQGQGQGQPPPDPRLNGAAPSGPTPTAPPTQGGGGGPVSGPSGPAPGLPGAPSGGAAPPPLEAILAQETQAFQQAQAAGDQQGMQLHGRNVQQLTQALQNKGGGMINTNRQAMAEGGGPGAPMPQGVPPPPAPQGGLPPPGGPAPQAGPNPAPPVPPVGVPGQRNPPPYDIKTYEEQMKEREATANKLNVKGSDLPKMSMALDRMEQLNTQPMFTGLIGPQMFKENALSTFTGHKSEEGRNTELFESFSSDLRASLLSQYGAGSGISDADLRAALGRIPNASMDPKIRAIKITQLKEDLKAFEYIDSRFQELTQGGMMAKNAQNKAYAEYNVLKPGWNKLNLEKPKVPKDTPIGPEGQTHSYKNPNSALSQTVDALTDVAKNTGRGAMNLVGLGDRDAAVADVERQDARAGSEPIYGGAKQIGEIAKFAPALPFGPLGATAVGGVIAASQPKSTLTGQLSAGATDAAASGLTLGVLNSSRLAFVKSQMGKLAEVINTEAHNSPAYHAAVAKLAELEPEFLALSKKTATETLSPVTNAVKGTWNALPKTVRSIITGTLKYGSPGAVAAGAYKYMQGEK